MEQAGLEPAPMCNADAAGSLATGHRAGPLGMLLVCSAQVAVGLGEFKAVNPDDSTVPEKGEPEECRLRGQKDPGMHAASLLSPGLSPPPTLITVTFCSFKGEICQPPSLQNQYGSK